MADSTVGQALPPNIRASIEERLRDVPEEGWYAEEPCAGAKFHSPTPLTRIDTWITPKPMPGCGADADRLVVCLCPTCAANLHVLRALMLAYDGELPWPVRREFGNKLRALAIEGWRYWVENRDAAWMNRG